MPDELQTVAGTTNSSWIMLRPILWQKVDSQKRFLIGHNFLYVIRTQVLNEEIQFLASQYHFDVSHDGPVRLSCTLSWLRAKKWHAVMKLSCYHDIYFIIFPKNHNTAMLFHHKHVQKRDWGESACREGWLSQAGTSNSRHTEAMKVGKVMIEESWNHISAVWVPCMICLPTLFSYNITIN